MSSHGRNLLAIIGPGILVAATGVGAGDLATSAFTGRALGMTVLWAVVLGAFFKFVLNEGLARWQLATGRTLVEGCCDHFGSAVRWLFLGYLVVWSFLVAAALMSAVGVTCHAIFPLFGPDAVQTNKVAYGVLHSLVAVVLVMRGGFRLFEQIMSVCTGVMFVVIVATAVATCPSWSEAFSGLLLPRIPPGGVSWTIALIGGVGGTVTVLSYGYWIREKGREGIEALRTCRIDLAAAYGMTALFGLGMVMIGSSLPPMTGGGATLVVNIANQLEATMGAAGPLVKWSFLIGAWSAVFSSLLGVWQGVPYLFADVWSLQRGAESTRRTSGARRGSPDPAGSALPGEGAAVPTALGAGLPTPPGESPAEGAAGLIRDAGRCEGKGDLRSSDGAGSETRAQRPDRVDTESLPYRGYLCAIALVPSMGLMAFNFQAMQKTYAIAGALFVPLLAIALLVMNGRTAWVGPRFRNSLPTAAVLIAIVLFFVLAGVMEVREKLIG